MIPSPTAYTGELPTPAAPNRLTYCLLLLACDRFTLLRFPPYNGDPDSHLEPWRLYGGPFPSPPTLVGTLLHSLDAATLKVT